MKIDCNPYRTSLDKAHPLFEKYKDDKGQACNIISSTSHIPLLAVVEYALLFIWPGEEKLENLKKRLIEFYKYTEIVSYL